MIKTDYKERTKLNYISTASFNGAFWSYSTSLNTTTYTNVGSLVPLAGATPANCPAGLILRATGKKLYPGGAYPGIKTLMVGVFDPQSGLSGYIDPNSPFFAVYNADKPVEVVDGSDLSGGIPHLGPSVYSAGSVIAAGQIHSTGFTNLVPSSSAIVINPSVGPFFTYIVSASQSTQTITAPYNFPLGTVATFIFYAIPGYACTITFSTGFRSSGTYVIAAGTNKVYTISFVSDSINLLETSRTAVLS